MTVDIRTIQEPLKERYRAEPNSALITLTATGSESDVPMACSVEVGRAIHQAQAHKGTGGAGTAACSGDMLLGALAACAQVTCQMVAAAMGLTMERIAVRVDGDIDLRGTLGVDRSVPVGFQDMRLKFEIDAPDASPEELTALQEKTLKYCVVLRTLVDPPDVKVDWVTSS